MGSDIHAFIEIRESPESDWENYHEGELNLLRDYDLFSALCGVRKSPGEVELIPPRGLPQDSAYGTFRACHYRVVEPDSAIAFNEDTDFARSGISSRTVVVKRNNCEFVFQTGYHHFSYLSDVEIRQCLDHYGYDVCSRNTRFAAVLSAMKTLSERFECRLVFWFDS